MIRIHSFHCLWVTLTVEAQYTVSIFSNQPGLLLNLNPHRRIFKLSFSPSLLRNIKGNLAIGDISQLFLKSEDLSENLEHIGNYFLQN